MVVVTLMQKAIERKFIYKYQSGHLLVNIQNSFHFVPRVQLASNNAKVWTIEWRAG